MADNKLSVGVQIWVVKRSGRARHCVDGPFRVVAFDRETVYAVRGSSKAYGEFFPVDEVALERKAAEESLKRTNKGG